jgi:ribosomal protein S18 acetylase RimI-like enzyme
VAHVFKNRECAALTVSVGGVVVHRTCLFPGYFRFPFMGSDDLQLGDIWTHPEYRNRGMARFAVAQVLSRVSRPGRKLWYLVQDTNTASIRTAERAGFAVVGRGHRVERFGVRVIGSFQLTSPSS